MWSLSVAGTRVVTVTQRNVRDDLQPPAVQVGMASTYPSEVLCHEGGVFPVPSARDLSWDGFARAALTKVNQKPTEEHPQETCSHPR